MTEVVHPELFHNKCVCQICTCHKHHCPHAELDMPMASDTTYGKDFHKHPLHVWTKPQQKGTFSENAGPPEDRHYDYINSAYREHYPGHPVGAREKYKPRVKDEDSHLPFHGGSQYKTNFGPKSSKLEGPSKRHDGYRPTDRPFEGGTTYKSDYDRKKITQRQKKPVEEVNFPPGYRFDGGTTYGNSYVEHPLSRGPNYKPVDKISEKGPHDLNTIYRQDYQERPHDHHCPILDLPRYGNKIHVPNAHFGYDSVHNRWYERK